MGHRLEAMPAIAGAAAAGELGWSKLRLLAQVAEPASETKWLDVAREMSVGQLARVVGAYRRASDTDDPDRSHNHRERRGIWLFDEPDGLVRITGLLEPDDAAVLRAALAAQDQSEVGRCQLHNGPPICTHTARRMCCDALIRPLIHRDGQPLDLGRARRLVNRAQRRALRFRDGPGCAFPGCAARHVDAHHVVFWDDGGATDLDNLVLLCRHHHRLLHEGGYAASLVGGRPRFFRPNGTPIRPPNPPPADPVRGSTELRRRHRAVGHAIDHHAAEARSGGAPWWSPQPTLDALFT